MLTCLDLAWAAVGPFFLKTVTVSQSLSAMISEGGGGPLDTRNVLIYRKIKFDETILCLLTRAAPL